MYVVRKPHPRPGYYSTHLEASLESRKEQGLSSEKICSLQVLSNYCVEHYPKHDFDVRSVSCCGEVGVDDLAFVQVAIHKLALNEATCSINIAIWTCRGERQGGLRIVWDDTSEDDR